MKKYSYKHIVSGKISDLETPHPLDNVKDKSYFIDLLSKDLRFTNFNDISNNKKNLFRIYSDNFYYNVFIEFPDGGGKDITFNSTEKKVGIPYNIKAFQNLIANYERVFVINVYIPLNADGSLDVLNRVYLIVNPKEIYSSKVIQKGTNNSSSRWVDLKDILEIIKSKSYKNNKKNNVYLVHNELLYWFFNSVLKKEYINMINHEMNNIDLKELNKNKSRTYTKFRSLFRELLIEDRGYKCEIICCEIDKVELMIASHIKPVNKIINDSSLTEKEKIREISDPNNGFLLCPNHDSLFDKFLITFNNNGVLKTSDTMIKQIAKFNLIDHTHVINLRNKNVYEYLEFHNKEFEKKNKKNIIQNL